MSVDKLASGDAFRLANDEVEHYQAQNARAKKAQQAREAEQAERDAGLQADLKSDTMRRHPEWFA